MTEKNDKHTIKNEKKTAIRTAANSKERQYKRHKR